MNLNDPKTLAAELLQLSVYLEMANQSLHRLTAAAVAQAGLNTPDAGLVVKGENIPHPHLWAGPDPQTMVTGWWDPVIVQIEAYAWCRNWPLVAFTVLDCAAVPHAMTWRPA